MSFFSRKPYPAPEGFDPPVDDQGRFASDLFCHECHYNLRGLPRSLEACPECGANPGPSVDNYRRMWFSETWLKYWFGSDMLLFLLGFTYMAFALVAIVSIEQNSGLANKWILILLGIVLILLAGLGYMLAGAKIWLINDLKPDQTTAFFSRLVVFGLLLGFFGAMLFFEDVTRGQSRNIRYDIGLIAGILVAFGIWMIQFQIVRQYMTLLKTLKCQELPWWSYCAAFPVLPLFAITFTVLDSFYWRHMDFASRGVVELSFALPCMLVFYAQITIHAMLAYRVYKVVAHAIYTRHQARQGDPAPAEVVLPLPAYGWYQGWLARSHGRWLAKASKQPKRG